MSRFFSPKYAQLVPYTPGEQPRDAVYIKLNTNESPFPPSGKAVKAALEEASRLQLYPDPRATLLKETLAESFSIKEEEIILGNGSDEILFFAFSAFCDEKTPAVFPAISYGFYEVFADICRVPYEKKPLSADFSIDILDYFGNTGTIFIANPNAPTGLLLSLSDIESILKSNPDRVVVIDEAYIDFGGESALPLIRQYDNLLVVQTFSKSRSMAGARLGMGMASPAIIRDLETVRNSLNPYNINRMTMAAGLATLLDEDYTRANCQSVIENREFTKKELERLGFTVTDSKANFLFAKSDRIGGEALYRKLRDRGILVRHFSVKEIEDYNRITVGSMGQMRAFISAVTEILEEV